MNTISAMMADDHRACDARFVALENLLAEGDWSAAATALPEFRASLQRHLDMEELELFPAFERATGSPDGPTAVMRMEHGQMRGLLDQLAAAVETHNLRAALGLSESLMVLLQQHNMKEEQVLYPMADETIPDTAAIVEQIRAHTLDA